MIWTHSEKRGHTIKQSSLALDSTWRKKARKTTEEEIEDSMQKLDIEEEDQLYREL